MHKKIFFLLFFTIPSLAWSEGVCVDTCVVNAPANSCPGNWQIFVAGFYWNAHQDGMAFAIDNAVSLPPVVNPTREEVEKLNYLYESHYGSLKSKWNLGTKLGLIYRTCLDNWDAECIWTYFAHRSTAHVGTGVEDHHTILPIWTDFFPAQGNPTYLRDIHVRWRLLLNLIDLDIGRRFWVSQKVNLRPMIGLRYASIDQVYKMELKGGSFSPRIDPDQDPYTDTVEMHNDYWGFGPHGGVQSEWNVGCGFAFYGNFAAALIYGHFDIKDVEKTRDKNLPIPRT